MAGETAVETPVAPPLATMDEPVKEKEALVEEEKKVEEAETPADEAEEKKDEEKKPEEKKEKKKKEVVPPPPQVHKKDFEQDVVYLYQMNRTPTVPSISPYCLKVETWLKLNGVKFESIFAEKKRSKRASQLPFIEMNGEEIGDSDNIIKTLGKKFEKDIDEGLSAEQKNVQHAMVAMVENHLNWITTYWKFGNVDNLLRGYKINLQTFFGVNWPTALLSLAFKHTICRKNFKKSKSAISGYSADEVQAMGESDFKVLSELLGEKQFFFGDEPHTLDLVTFVQLAMLLTVDEEAACPLRDFVKKECGNLEGLFSRMKDRAWADHWDEACGDKMEMNPHIPKPDPPKEEVVEEKKEEEKETADEKKEEGADKEKGDKDEKEKEEKKEEENKEEENKEAK